MARRIHCRTGKAAATERLTQEQAAAYVWTSPASAQALGVPEFGGGGCPSDIDPRAGSATAHRPAPTANTETQTKTETKTNTAPKTTAPKSNQRTCTHDGRGHGYLGYNPGTHTHPTSDHGPHMTGKCAGA